MFLLFGKSDFFLFYLERIDVNYLITYKNVQSSIYIECKKRICH